MWTTFTLAPRRLPVRLRQARRAVDDVIRTQTGFRCPCHKKTSIHPNTHKGHDPGQSPNYKTDRSSPKPKGTPTPVNRPPSTGSARSTHSSHGNQGNRMMTSSDKMAAMENKMAARDKVADQLNDYLKDQTNPTVDTKITTGTGAPVGHKTAILTAGPRGPQLMQDFVFTDELAHFQRERIPERVVHAKGGGAFGHFEVTHDITKYCKAEIFSAVGKKTPMAARFSTVGGESGSADTARDPRGFALKFYTKQGNWDLVGNNTPIFFVRDPIMFPSFIHTQKRNPATHCKDPDAFWDFTSLRPETTHQVMFLFADRGTPDGFRHMNGYGSHTFKLVNSKDEEVYCKFHMKTDQGIKNLASDEADKMTGLDPDYAIRDLYNAIANGQGPSWTMYLQVLSLEDADKVDWNPFDVTKVWSQKTNPLIPVGKIVLDKNPKDYFAEIEQIAFSPAHFVPGVEASPDKMLQGRLYSYSDTHRHRLGTNYLQIPVNCPYRTTVLNYQRDGPDCVNDNQAGAPNYFPNSFGGPKEAKIRSEHPFQIKDTIAKRYETADEDNFSQSGTFYREVLDVDARDRLAANLAGHMMHAQRFIQDRAIGNFTKVDPALGSAIRTKIDAMAGKQA